MRIYKHKKMPRLDLSTRKRVFLLNSAGYSSSEICHRLREEDTIVTVRSVHWLLQKFRRYGCIRDLPRNKRQINQGGNEEGD